MFVRWPRRLSGSIQVIGIQLPGRETRCNETPVDCLQRHVGPICSELKAYDDRPVAFFGHSMGALLAFETARALCSEKRQAPVHLFLAASQAPQIRRAPEQKTNFSDAELISEIERLSGSPPQALANSKMRSLLLPMLRADFLANANYVCPPGDPLPCPITAIGGTRDRSVSVAALEEWRCHSASGFSLRMIDGDHFFPVNRAPALLDLLGTALASVPGNCTASFGSARSW